MPPMITRRHVLACAGHPGYCTFGGRQHHESTLLAHLLDLQGGCLIVPMRPHPATVRHAYRTTDGVRCPVSAPPPRLAE